MSGQETIKAYSFKQTYLHHINNFDIGVIHVPTHPHFYPKSSNFGPAVHSQTLRRLPELAPITVPYGT